MSRRAPEALEFQAIVNRHGEDAVSETASGHEAVGDSLDHLIGTWTAEEGREFDEATRDLSEIDPSLWT